MVAAAPAQEFVPAQHRRILGDFGLLAALGEHIAHPDWLGKGVRNGGQNDIVQCHILTDGFKFMVKLIQRHSKDGAGFL